MYYRMRELQSDSNVNHDPLSLVCHNCDNLGSFVPIGQQLLSVEAVQMGLMSCPNPVCHATVLVVRKNGRVVNRFPPESVGFDKSRIPDEVADLFSEALTCYANSAFRAAAMMVRRTLEELCAVNGAEGSDLSKRIAALGNEIVIPAALLKGMTNLRLLGNDAAHTELRNFGKVDKEEVEAAIDVTKEILKAMYQYEALIERLEALKKPPEAAGLA